MNGILNYNYNRKIEQTSCIVNYNTVVVKVVVGARWDVQGTSYPP